MVFKFTSEDPLVFASKILAINPPTRYGRIYTTIYCGVLFPMVYGVVLFFNEKSSQLSVLVKFSLWLQLVGLTAIAASDFLTVLIWPENFQPPTKKLKKIEETVEPFGFSVDDQTLRVRLGTLEILLSFGIPFGFGILDLIDVIKGHDLPYLPIYFAHYVYAITLININEFLFVNYLHMIKRRFKELNRLVDNVRCSIDANRDIRLNKMEDEMVLDQLRIFKKAHYDLTQSAHEVNESYGLHILISMTFSIILITEQLYQNYEAIAWHGRTVLESLYTNYTWTGFHMTRISLMIFACYFTSAEANKTASLIHAILIQKASQKLKDEVLHISLQMQKQLSFTAAGFFDINLGAFTSVTGAVVTYLLIMIQMESVNQGGKNTSIS